MIEWTYQFTKGRFSTMKTVICSKNAPAAVGPYAQGWTAGDFVFTSGQLPVDPATGEMPAGVAAQAEQSCKNVSAVLEAAGASLQDVVKTTCFLADMGDFATVNEIYAQYFNGAILPARAAFQVAALPKAAMVEIELVAYQG